MLHHKISLSKRHCSLYKGGVGTRGSRPHAGLGEPLLKSKEIKRETVQSFEEHLKARKQVQDICTQNNSDRAATNRTKHFITFLTAALKQKTTSREQEKV